LRKEKMSLMCKAGRKAGREKKGASSAESVGY
jgi:hypothetical protein